MTPLMLVSTVCSGLSLALFAYWVSRKVAAAREDGLRVLADLDTTGDPFKDWPLVARLNRMALGLLPVVENARAENRFGLATWFARAEVSLVQSGLIKLLSPHQFLAISLAAGILAAAAGLVLTLLFAAGPLWTLTVMTAFAGAGGVVPTIVLRNLVADRLSFIAKRLPFAVEFMLLAMEARAAFNGALEVYCEQARKEPLSDELKIVLREMEFGMTLQDALTRFANRVRSPEVSAFAMAVNTGLETGQPIKTILQTQSDVCRQQRFDSAEVIAKTASTRAIFPLMIVAMAVLSLLVIPLLLRLKDSAFL